jgi:hypothetical protein
LIKHWQSETVKHCGPKDARPQERVVAVLVGRNCCDEGASVRLRDAKQALLLAIVWSCVDQVLVHLLVEQKGGVVLSDVGLGDKIRPSPVLA